MGSEYYKFVKKIVIITRKIKNTIYFMTKNDIIQQVRQIYLPHIYFYFLNSKYNIIY